MAARFCGPGRPFEGFAYCSPIGPKWTGAVRLIEDKLEEPLRWRKPRRVFVNSMSDLFHEAIADRDIAAVFGVMAACPQHTFLVLTKRAKRMQEWARNQSGAPLAGTLNHFWTLRQRAEAVGVVFPASEHQDAECSWTGWPLSNVWLGVSCEDQKTADERIPLLTETPAAHRFVSYEPALGRIDFTRRLPWSMLDEIDWLVFGGESGPQARLCNIEWARSARAQCRKAGTAFFMKQAGSRPFVAIPEVVANAPSLDVCPLPQMLVSLKHPKGGDPSEWPADLRVREVPW